MGLDRGGHPVAPIPQSPGGISATCWHVECSLCFGLQESRSVTFSSVPIESHFSFWGEKKKGKGKIKSLCLHSSICVIVPGGTGAPCSQTQPSPKQNFFHTILSNFYQDSSDSVRVPPPCEKSSAQSTPRSSHRSNPFHLHASP